MERQFCTELHESIIRNNKNTTLFDTVYYQFDTIVSSIPNDTALTYEQNNELKSLSWKKNSCFAS